MLMLCFSVVYFQMTALCCPLCAVLLALQSVRVPDAGCSGTLLQVEFKCWRGGNELPLILLSCIIGYVNTAVTAGTPRE